ncbi:N-acetylmannosamine-6-phosphate 2-epimerase [Paracoccus sp. (in: a-proteobacteria)]|uniref:N-acetylmannosamine-6-phosphate 2-epimerase n=1 Tax=Paracoccus sp. TaxID=267 RepID=UPI003A86BCCC
MTILPKGGLPKGGLIVSCQARADNPLHGPVFMAAMAQAAEAGGAVAIRANGAQDIAAIRHETPLPVIGINKVFDPDEAVYITPSRAAADAVITAGAGIVALDCTDRPRLRGEDWRIVLAHIHDAGCLAFADVATLAQGVAAAEEGADFVASTLSGYCGGPVPAEPDYALISDLAAHVAVPVIAEGRLNTPDRAARALDAGAHAVVVGTMITNPREITRAFVARLTALA